MAMQFGFLGPYLGYLVSAGDRSENVSKDHLDALMATLQKLPRIHLQVLDAVIVHLRA